MASEVALHGANAHTQSVAVGDRRDRYQNRLITILDAAACTAECTLPECESE